MTVTYLELPGRRKPTVAKRTIYKRADNGRICSPLYAKSHPKTTYKTQVK